MKLKKIFIIKIGIILIFALIYAFIPALQTAIKQVVFMLSTVDVTAMKNYILAYGIWAPAVSFALIIFQCIIAPLPGFIITFANAALFGWVKGALLSWCGQLAGAALCYWIARFYGRSVVERFTSKFLLEEVDSFFERYGKFAVLLARLFPFISFDVVSYAAGLTSMGFRGFFLATGLGMLPVTILYSYLGDVLTGSVKIFVVAILILVFLVIFIAAARKIYRERSGRLLPQPQNK